MIMNAKDLRVLEESMSKPEREAILGLLQVKKIHGTRQRVYRCLKCKGFHLTSRLFHYQNENDFGTDFTKQDWLD